MSKRACWLCVSILLPVLIVTGCGTDDSTKAHVRLLNVSQDYRSLDMQVGDSAGVKAVNVGGISEYLALTADTYTVSFRKNGVSSSLQSTDQKLSTSSYQTYVASGSTGKFSAFSIDENQSSADSGKAKVQLLNAATEAGAVDVYLTGSDVALDDTSPLFSAATTGSAAAEGYVSVDAGTYRLRVMAAGSKTDVRLDAASVSFSDRGVVSLVINDTVGGVLVNAMVLPQQGSLNAQNNTKARLRAVIGTIPGTTVTGSWGDVVLLTSAPSNTIGAYKLVESGSQKPEVMVDAAGIATDSLSVEPGSDNTLLVWQGAGGTMLTVLSDNNRAASSGYAKLRLVHAIAGVSDPISLSVDYSPVAEGIAAGNASAYSEIAAS